MEAVSFGFIVREILSRQTSAARKKNVIYIIPRDREENEPCTTVAQFSRSFVDDGRKDGRRSEASGIVEPDTRLWGVDGCLLARVPHRENLISNVSPERVLRACIYVIWHALSTCASNSRARPANSSGRRILQDFRAINSRDFTSFLCIFLSESILFLCINDTNLFKRSDDVRSKRSLISLTRFNAWD